MSETLLDNFVYLDYPATTPCDPRVFEKMSPYFCKLFGNPHSASYALGWASNDAVEVAYAQIADFLNVDKQEIIFTSGATESNLIALRGVMTSRQKTEQNHLITTQTEHKSTLTCCKQLENEGFNVTYLPVNSDGLIDLDELSRSITEQTRIVSVVAVNNETGVIQPMEQIGQICLERNVLFHTDATQALGKIPIDFQKWNVALASFSAHKVYGPKGIGALYIRKKPPVKLRPVQIGGGQQRGVRGGTIPVPLCVGFGEACRLLQEEFHSDLARISHLSNRLLTGLQTNDPLARLNGSSQNKVPHIVNIGFPFVEGESIAMGMENICVSTGSACSSDQLEASHVLKAMHVDDIHVQSSIRFGLGRFTSDDDVDYTIKKTTTAVQRLREMSPLWDMYKNGIDLKTIKWK
jgi:cysteine desulfurase